jgi:hypothetical protein
MGCTTSAAKKKKEEAKAQVQAVLDPDEVIDCFDDTDDLDVGFKYIVEKEVELIKDIRMTNGFFNLIETQINNEVVYPERLQKMNQLFNRIFGNLRNEQKLFFKNNQNIDFSNVELDTFTEAEVYHPQLSKNKHEYIKLIFKQIKNFVQNVKLPRKLHYENCRAFLLAKFVKIKKAPPDDNDEKIDMNEVIEGFASEIKDTANMNKYWLPDSADKNNDHVLEAYKVFEHNMNTSLKLMLLFYEKSNMEYQVLSKSENKINYSILVNNYLFWSITNLERTNFPVYKLYLSELSRINHQINTRIGKTQLIELIFKYRGESFQFFRELKVVKSEIERDIFGSHKNAETEEEEGGTILHKPLKEKFNHNFKILINETLPKIYDKFPKYKVQIEKAIEDHFDDFFNKSSPPFNIRTMVKLNKNLTEKTCPDYIMNFHKLVMYLQATVFKKKFNLDEEHFKKRTIRITEIMAIQLSDVNLETIVNMKDFIISNSHTVVHETLEGESKKFLEEYNTTNVTREFHIYIIFSLFVALSGIEMRKEAGKIVYRHNEYLSCSRYILFKLVNKLRNFDFSINNWTLINYMEFNVEDFLEKFTMSQNAKVQHIIDTTLLEKLRSGKIEEVVAHLKSQSKRLEAYLRFSMDQDKAYRPKEMDDKTKLAMIEKGKNAEEIEDSKKDEFDLDEVLRNLNKKEYSFSFKPLFQRATGTNSRHIIIFVSSFLNQAEDPEALWKDYVQGEPYTECYSFVWPTMDIYGYNEIKIQMEQEYMDNNVKSDMFHIGVNLLSMNHIKAIKLDKLNMNPFYKNLYLMSILCGKALAFFIGQLKLFESSTITLVGFSLGSIVAYKCLSDIYFMKKSNVIYNFVMIGSPLAKKNLDPEIVKLSVGSFFNIFSMDDKVLKYLSSMNSNFQNPCGLNEIVYEGSIYSTKKIKISNYDMTSLVHCHMDYTKYFKKIVEFVRKADDFKSISNFLFK